MKSEEWYALFVKTGEEDNIKERLMFRLKDSGIRAVVPKRCMRERRQGKWENKIRTLFPGYILLNGNISECNYDLFNNVPGVIRLLKDHSGPKEINPHEMIIINRLICNNDIIGFSSAYFEGESIVVTNGPLLGMEGNIIAVNKRKGRAKVRLNIMGEPRIVELCISFVIPA